MEVFTGSCLFRLFTVDVKFSRVINFARKSLFACIGIFSCSALFRTESSNMCNEGMTALRGSTALILQWNVG